MDNIEWLENPLGDKKCIKGMRGLSECPELSSDRTCWWGCGYSKYCWIRKRNLSIVFKE